MTMAETIAPVMNRPIWVDLASSNPAVSQDYYRKLFGWNVEVDPDPQYGGYAVAKIDGKDVAGIGGKMMPEAPDAWSVYIGTDDIDALVAKVQAAGGAVVAPPMPVGNQGKMAVFTDPTGAYISAWQPIEMMGFVTGIAGTFDWAELTARGIGNATPFYAAVFGWDPHSAPMSREADSPIYTEFHLGEATVAGGMEMPAMVPAEVPSYWMPYFSVDDVDAAHARAIELGGMQVTPPQDFPGGRFGIISDPHRALFGLLKTK
jgi:hypothetical protein